MSLQVVVNFKVIDESADWIVIDKPAPLIVHPANRKPEPTLLGGLQNLLAFEIQNGASLGIVNRLDRETSGVVLVAKTTAAARELGKIFEKREAEKEYLAVVVGWPELDAWRCDAAIGRAGAFGISEIWVRQIVSPRGRACSTAFEVVERFDRHGEKFTVVRCFPETGRMHQIRVHLAATGFPIVGDKLYSGGGEAYLEWMAAGWTAALQKKLTLPRHALHAARLRLPWQGRYFEWQAELPLDLREFIAGAEISHTPDVVIWSRYD
jgi:23S rRNA pseudouridine1911/1915/1917 synthase